MGREGLQKNHKGKGWLLQSWVQRGRILAVSQDEKHGQHWRKTHCTLHPFPIPSTQNQAGSGPVAGLDSLPASQTWGSLTRAQPQGLLLLPYALPLPIHLGFLHFVPIALALGYYVPWWIRKYRKESFLPKPPFSVQSLNSSPREHNEFRGEAQFGLSCCFTRISFWAESLKRDKYT